MAVWSRIARIPRDFINCERGVALTEYLVVAVFIAIGAAAGVAALAPRIGDLYSDQQSHYTNAEERIAPPAFNPDGSPVGGYAGGGGSSGGGGGGGGNTGGGDTTGGGNSGNGGGGNSGNGGGGNSGNGGGGGNGGKKK